MPTLAPRTLSLSVLLLASALACSDRGNHELLVEGNEAVNANIPDTATDGWSINFSSFVVVLHDPGIIERRDRKPVWVREYGVTVWDLLGSNDAMGVLDRTIRASDVYDGVDFRVAPASASTYEAIAGNVDDDLVDDAVDGDYSIRVVGSAAGPMGENIDFAWEFATNTRYRCALDDDARISITADSSEVTVIEILGDALFRADDGSLAFQPIADADGDGDGNVTTSELDDAGLLGGIEELTRSIGSVRGVDVDACESFEGGAGAEAEG